MVYKPFVAHYTNLLNALKMVSIVLQTVWMSFKWSILTVCQNKKKISHKKGVNIIDLRQNLGYLIWLNW